MLWFAPFLFWSLLVTSVGAMLSSLFDDEVKMGKANCHEKFITFENTISLTASRVSLLMERRKKLEDKIRLALNSNKEVKFKGFFIQGSLSRTFNTTVLKKDGSYDVDLGVYLQGKPDVSGTTVQKYVLNAVSDKTKYGAKHLEKCIRVVYAGDFDIDLPVYYLSDPDSIPHLAIKGEEWREDDPKGTAQWFKDVKAQTDGRQLVRIIKYLKVWADSGRIGFKAPSGFALTVWATRTFIKAEERDDVAMLATLKKLHEMLSVDFTCISPRAPYDDLVKKLNTDQKDKFLDSLKLFLEDAKTAISTDDIAVATMLWQKHLGVEFF